MQTRLWVWKSLAYGLPLLALVGWVRPAVGQGMLLPDSGWVTAAELPYTPPHLVRKLDLRSAASLPTNWAAFTNLQHLHLGSASITHLPAGLVQATKLTAIHLDRTFSLDHNQACQVLAQLPNLRHLSLSFCHLKAVPASLPRLTQLHVLNLERNWIADVSAVGALVKLRGLYLGINEKLTVLSPQLLQLKQLRDLRLDGCRLAALPAQVTQWRYLEALSLRSNPLSALPAGLAQLHHLRELDLAHCDGLNWAQTWPIISSLANLRRLDLSNNGISAMLVGAIPAQVDTLIATDTRNAEYLLPKLILHGNITYLDISRSRLASSAVEELMRLTNVRYLNLSSLDLKTLPQGITQLAQLQTLILKYNDLAPADFARLSALPNLKEVHLSYSKYSQDDLQAIQAVLPNTRLVL